MYISYQLKDNNLTIIKSRYTTSYKKRFYKKNKYNDDDYKKYRIKYINKIKYKLNNYIKNNWNFYKSFLTLTFENQEQAKNKEYVLKCFHKFSTIIKRSYPDFSYIFVLEKTLNNVYHIHMITNLQLEKYSKNDDRIDKNIDVSNFCDKGGAFGDFWTYGFIDVKKIYSENVALYILKYITKDISEKGRIYYISQDVKINSFLKKLNIYKYNIENCFNKILNTIEKDFYIIYTGIKSELFDWLIWINSFNININNILYSEF